MKVTAQTGLISAEDEPDIALHLQEETLLEQALQEDNEASVEMPTGKIQELPPPLPTQREARRYLFPNAFEHSQKVEIDGLFEVRCFTVDEKDTRTKRLER